MKRSLWLHWNWALPFIYVLALGTARAESPEETLKGLPAPAQKTIKAESKQQTLVSIEKKERDGKARYKVLIKNKDMEKRVFVDDSGKVLRLKQDVALATLPAAVRKTCDVQGKGAQFVRSTRVTQDGKTEW